MNSGHVHEKTPTTILTVPYDVMVLIFEACGDSDSERLSGATCVGLTSKRLYVSKKEYTND